MEIKISEVDTSKVSQIIKTPEEESRWFEGVTYLGDDVLSVKDSYEAEFHALVEKTNQPIPMAPLTELQGHFERIGVESLEEAVLHLLKSAQ